MFQKLFIACLKDDISAGNKMLNTDEYKAALSNGELLRSAVSCTFDNAVGEILDSNTEDCKAIQDKYRGNNLCWNSRSLYRDVVSAIFKNVNIMSCVDQQDSTGHTLFYSAIVCNNGDVLSAMLGTPRGKEELTKNKDKIGENLLHTAMLCNSKKATAAILEIEEGRKLLFEKDKSGRAPLDIAYGRNTFNNSISFFSFSERLSIYASHPIMTLMSNKLFTCKVVAACAVIALVCSKAFNASTSPKNMLNGLSKALFGQQGKGI